MSPIHVGASLAAVPLSAGEELPRTADQPHGVAEPGVVRRPERPVRGPYELLAAPSPESPQSGDGLVLMTAPLLIGAGTMLARSALLLAAGAVGAIDLNPEDAAAQGIADGDAVEIRSRHGRVRAAARCVAAMPRGRAFLAENAAGVRTSLLLAWSDPLPRVEVTRA